MSRRQTAHRRDVLWIAAVVHRISGVLLACFLPLHFLVLGLAIRGEAQLDGVLKWTDNPLVKLAEMGLVFLLVVHLAGGLRILVMELLGWRDGQQRMALVAAGVAALAAFAFAVQAWM